MTKLKVNRFEFALVESPDKAETRWIISKGFSVHLGDEVFFGEPIERTTIYKGRVIRRSNVPPHITGPKNFPFKMHGTANQFPVADHPVQPELPVVPVSTMINEHIKSLDKVIKQLKELI